MKVFQEKKEPNKSGSGTLSIQMNFRENEVLKIPQLGRARTVSKHLTQEPLAHYFL